MPFVTSSVHAPSSDARSPDRSDALCSVRSFLQVVSEVGTSAASPIATFVSAAATPVEGFRKKCARKP